MGETWKKKGALDKTGEVLREVRVCLFFGNNANFQSLLIISEIQTR